MAGKPILCGKDKLAICGTADPTRGMAPYADSDYEVWTVAVGATFPDVARIDLQFEMHPRSYWSRDKNVTDRLKKTTTPIYMHEHYRDIPTSVRYPIEAVQAYQPYFTNSIAYMEALAYHSFLTTGKPKHVALFGVHMSAKEEYTEQRPCCEFWLGMMKGGGMSFELAPAGALMLAQGLYGYEKYNPVCYDMRQRLTALGNGINQANAEARKWELQAAKNEGAVTECDRWMRKFQRGEY